MNVGLKDENGSTMRVASRMNGDPSEGREAEVPIRLVILKDGKAISEHEAEYG